MYRVSIELYKHQWKFGRTRNAVGTRASGFFDFSQTFTSVYITRWKHEVHVFYFFQKITRREKRKQLVNFDYQNVNSLCSRHYYINCARQFCVSMFLWPWATLTQTIPFLEEEVKQIYIDFSEIPLFQMGLLIIF